MQALKLQHTTLFYNQWHHSRLSPPWPRQTSYTTHRYREFLSEYPPAPFAGFDLIRQLEWAVRELSAVEKHKYWPKSFETHGRVAKDDNGGGQPVVISRNGQQHYMVAYGNVQLFGFEGKLAKLNRIVPGPQGGKARIGSDNFQSSSILCLSPNEPLLIMHAILAVQTACRSFRFRDIVWTDPLTGRGLSFLCGFVVQFLNIFYL